MLDDVGFYTIFNKKTQSEEKYYNKIQAFMRAKSLNLKVENIQWNFNDEIFKSVDWTIEPTDTLNQLYKTRARQIREEYDYIVMFISGGADSTNMLFSFLYNDLLVDEIIASAPLSGLRDWKRNRPYNDVKNTIEETFVSQIPFIQKLKSRFPNLNIRIHDYFEDMLNYKQDDWLIKGSDWMHPTMAGRYNLDRYSHLKVIAESGKKIAVVQGIDKPQLCRFKNHFSILFRDHPYNNKYDSINHPNTFPVFFYHSPDLPSLIVKQAHVTARFLMRPENILIYKAMPYNWEYAKDRTNPLNNKNYNGLNGDVYERGIVPAIYPWIKKWSFQAEKPDKMFLGNHDHWFYEHHSGTSVWSMMKSDLLNLQKSLDSNFFHFDKDNNELLGLKPFFRSYNIGKIANFTSKGILLPELPSSEEFDKLFSFNNKYENTFNIDTNILL